MSEAVEILIKADDKASEKFAEVAKQADEASNKSGKAFSGLTAGAKATKVVVGALGDIAGDGVLTTLATQLAGSAEKIEAFSNVAKKGGREALAMRAGLVGLAATAGFAVGKALGDLIFQTKAYERSMERAREATQKFNEELQRSNAKIFANELEDIELIREPDKKQAAIKALLSQTEKDIVGVTASLKESQKEADKWADAWILFTDTRKEAAAQSVIDLEADKSRLEQLKAQRDAARDLASERTKELAAIKATNEAKDKSESFLQTLRDEVQLLKATREEQIKIEAARSTTVEDRGEAEQLLRERDALRQKAQAQKEAEDAQRRAAEEAAKAAQQAIDDAAREQQRVTDLIAWEEERLQLRRIELELGKEAARTQALINQGVDEATAKRLAADEAALDALGNKRTSAAGTLTAVQGRLLTRGQSSPVDETNRILQGVKRGQDVLAEQGAKQLEAQQATARNTANTLTVRPTT